MPDYMVIHLTGKYDRNSIVFKSKNSSLTINGRQIVKPRIEFIPADKLNIGCDDDSLDSLISGYVDELSRLRGQMNEYISRNSSQDGELAEYKGCINSLQDRIDFLELENSDLKEKLTKENNRLFGWKKDDTEAVRNLVAKISALNEELEQSRESNHVLKEKLEKESNRSNDLQDENKKLSERVIALKNAYEKCGRENAQIMDECKSLKDRNIQLERDLNDVENTNRHLRNEQTEIQKIDLRGIVMEILQYSSDVSNAIVDKDESSQLREYLSMRTEYLRMNLKGLGIETIQHERGSMLGDERVDVQPVDTDEAEMNGKVKISDRMGCRFSSEYYADIPERVTMYLLKETVKETNEEDSLDTDRNVDEISMEKDVIAEEKSKETKGDEH